MMPSVLLYAGFATALIGGLVLLYPLPALRLSSPAHGIALLFVGLGMSAVALLLPARESTRAPPRTQLDRMVPRYQFAEHHETRIAAPPARVYAALHEVTAAEIRFFRLLTWIRRAGRAGPESILNAPERRPLLDVATRTTFRTLADEKGREIVIGTLVISPRGTRPLESAQQFARLDRPGYAKAAMNFLIESDGAGGSLLSTETRVFATDAVTRNRFAAYWRIILPGSAIIRRSWLAAARKRAEAPP